MTDHDCVRRLLDAFQLDELSPADARDLARHVRTCPSCASELGGISRLVALLGSLPVPPPSPHLNERILAVALADRARRHEHPSWLSDLRRQVVRGALRTTGTLAATIVSVALLGGVFVFAASQFVGQLAPFTSRATIAPVVTPTEAPPRAQTAEPTAPPAPVVTQTPAVTNVPATTEPAASPEPTPASTPSSSAAASPTPAPEPTPAPLASGTLEPIPSAQPLESPAPSPTDKPRRTPPPSASPTPSPSP